MDEVEAVASRSQPGGEMLLRLLGPVELLITSRQVDIGSPQQRAVLAVLAVDVGRPVSVATIIDRIWGKAHPDTARATLHTYMARLRRAIRDAGVAGPVLTRGSGGYVLDVERDTVDAYLFRSLVEQADLAQRAPKQAADLLRRALDLWRGTPLADLSGDWVDRVREAWRQRHIDAVVRWAETELRLGRAAQAIAPLSELAVTYPLAEQVTALMMRSLHNVGRTAEALDVYAAARIRLAEHLGADPGPDLRQLHEAILRGDYDQGRWDRTAPPPDDAPPLVVTPAQLPFDVRGFTGRAALQQRLDAMLPLPHQDGPTAIVISAIDGMAGVGKPMPGF